jgi:hypothetical protein
VANTASILLGAGTHVAAPMPPSPEAIRLADWILPYRPGALVVFDTRQ